MQPNGVGWFDTFFLSRADPVEVWKQGEITATAPTRAFGIEIQVMLKAQNPGQGAVYFDDVEITELPGS